MQEVTTIKEAMTRTRQRMEETVEDLRRELSHLRTGRASVTLLEGVRVDYYGVPTPLNQIAKVTTPDATLIAVQPFDVSLLDAIDKAIRAADLGLNPTNDGKLVRVPIPPLTEERRKELVKHVRNLGEDGKIAIRNIRRDANDQVKKLEKNKEISQDEEHAAQEQIQTETDARVKRIDELIKSKEQELMTV